jgi:hypothetical protein
MFVNFFEKFRVFVTMKRCFFVEKVAYKKKPGNEVELLKHMYSIIYSMGFRRSCLNCIRFRLLYCTALHCTALHCTALHCTALHCTALHCTGLVFILEFLTHSIVSGCPNRLLPNYRGSEVPTI